MTNREVKRMEAARELVRRLGEAGEDPNEVLAIMKGVTFGLFKLLDEKPGDDWWGGYRGVAGEWHYKLRRVRNSPVYGKRLFAGLLY